jgi:hypothetical protein
MPLAPTATTPPAPPVVTKPPAPATPPPAATPLPQPATAAAKGAPAAPAKPGVAPASKPGAKPAPAVNPEDEKLQKLAERLLGAMAEVNEKQRKDTAKQPDKAAAKPTTGARPKDKADATQ